MDCAVAVAYGWDDLDLGHDFHETPRGVRYTIGEMARQEVLGRLLALNHERYEEEVKAPMSPRAIQYRVRKYLDEARIKGASVHTLRHTMATHHVARGTDLKTLQETLGHADLATTSIYVSLAKKAQRQALQENAL